MTIRDQLSKSSPPPQMLNDTERPITPPPGPCTIYQENLDLVDGLRVLTKVGPHFYPGSVKTIESPSIFAVSVDGERGNKPHIYSAEELLDKTILEVKPRSCRYTPIGTRVCVFWSSKLNFLYPGTVKNVFNETQYVSIKLDDGDERDINISNVRLLPKGYPKVVVKDKESPIGVVEANTLSPVSVSAIKFIKSPSDKKSKENEFDEENAQLKLKSSGQSRKSCSQKLFDTKSNSDADAKPQNTDSNDPTLKDELLKDGARILTLKDGHFYPGRLNATRPPDIYGVLFDNERGFRPVIYAREQLLKDSVLDMRVKCEDIGVGSRVCVYWSSKYQYLHPGTIIDHDNEGKSLEKYFNISLDDGDTREIHIDQIRLLPQNFPKVAYNEDIPSPRKRSSSRPSSRSETPRSGVMSDSSRPSSALSNMSDSNNESDVKSPMSPLKVNMNGTTPPLSRDSTPLSSPAPKTHPKVFIPEPAPKPQTFDLVGMISSGIDKLVDKKKVVGNRPSGYNTGFNQARPPMLPSHHPNMQHPGMASPHPGMTSPHPGMQSPHPGMQSPHHGMSSPHPHMAPPHPGASTPNPHMMAQQQHFMMNPNPYSGYPQHHPPHSHHHQYSNMVPPSHLPPTSRISPPPPSQPPAQDNKVSSSTKPDQSDAENKAKSRLSNLIQAMSGKIKKPEPPASPADQILNKWQLAFNVKPPTPTKSPSKEIEESEAEDTLKEEEPVDDIKQVTGYLNSSNLACGLRILMMRNNSLCAGTIVTVTPSRMYTVRFKNGSFSETQTLNEQQLISISVLDREVGNGAQLPANSRVAIHNRSTNNTFITGTVVDFRNGVYVVQCDKGGFEEASFEAMKLLPVDYPKSKVLEETPEKTGGGIEQINKHKHKHNILLGYDFVDENDTDILAWDRAVQRRRKTEKPKSVSPPVPEIKQEVDLDASPHPETETKDTIHAEVKEKVESMLDQVSLEDRMRLSLLSNALKKHSPKKEVNQKNPGNKSPKHIVETVKGEEAKELHRLNFPC